MTLAMSWDEWAQHDGTALAARVRKGELTAAELAQQATAGVTKVDPQLSGVVEVFDDAIASPEKNGTNPDGPFAGLPFLMKDLGPTMQGRLQEMAGGAFIGQHGSWNRKPRAGYKVIFVPFAEGKPSGRPQDILTGFLNDSGDAQGRPVGLRLDKQGALLVADDVGNTIWRVTPATTSAAAR